MAYNGNIKPDRPKESLYQNFNNERYFGALVKPKHSDVNVKTSIVGNEGSVFSSLPLYEVKFSTF
jgi:hypothetical protein